VAYLGRYDTADSSCERVIRRLEPLASSAS
jgi:hypothetical protein